MPIRVALIFFVTIKPLTYLSAATSSKIFLAKEERGYFF